jgi:hypothetical protein
VASTLPRSSGFEVAGLLHDVGAYVLAAVVDLCGHDLGFDVARRVAVVGRHPHPYTGCARTWGSPGGGIC